MADEESQLDQPLEIRTRIVNDYLYSYGGVSHFFRALRDEEKLTGTRCPSCKTVYCPPRTRCGECYETTSWVDLPPYGVVVSAIDCYYVPPNYELHRYLDLPYTLALIKLEGADTCIYNTVYLPPPHKVNSVVPGDRVRAMFRESREGRLTDVYFILNGSRAL